MKKDITKQDCLSPVGVIQKQQSGEAIQIIDVRSRDKFQEKHIPGALNIPLDDLEKSIALFDTETLFITACGKGGGRSVQGAERLRHLGFDAVWLCGGIFGWFDTGTL